MSLLKVNTVQTDKLQSVAGVNRNSVLQVVSKEVTTLTSTTSTSFVDATDMFLAITPTSATSKILITFAVLAEVIRNSAGHYAAFQLLRDSTVIFSTTDTAFGINATGATQIQLRTTYLVQLLDSPSTINTVVYKLQFLNFASTNSATAIINHNENKSTITLMEIAQ